MINKIEHEGPFKKAIPVRSIIQMIDGFLIANDAAGAEETIKYRLAEALALGDERGSFAMYSELADLYRKQGRKEEALDAAAGALSFLEKSGYGNRVCGASCLINAAAVYLAFGMAEKSLSLYNRARAVYEEKLQRSDIRLGGLYNNMGLALACLDRPDDAEELYHKALSVISGGGKIRPEQAVTWLNLAELAMMKRGASEADEEVSDCIAAAWEALSKDQAMDHNYVLICEKCASAFSRCGYFMYEEELRERAAEIRESLQ